MFSTRNLSIIRHISLSLCGIISIVVLLALPSCMDDPLLRDDPETEGISDLHLTVSFFPDVDNALGGTRSAGNSIENLRTLAIAIFDNDKKLVRLVQNESLIGFEKGKHEEHPSMSPEDTANKGTWTEGEQDMATFRIEGVESGKYRIYAIANMPISENDIKVADGETWKNDEEKLRNIRVQWNEKNIGSNDQMFGYFTAADKKSTDEPLAGLEAGEVVVNGASTPLHCWLKRAASKVTIAFDPTGLHQNVNIYIHKVTIKDIPASCAIGVDNKPTAPDDLTGQSGSAHGDQLILNGETLYYDNNGIAAQDPGANDEDHQKWLHLTNGTGVRGSDHSATADALFFFENNQGDFKDTTENVRERYNKEPKAGWVHEYLDRPDLDKDKRPWDYDTKDKVNAGTYIEVEGYYNSTNELNVTSGPIIYRFMLGKNTTFNYNAQRNHHYKLTLTFKGWANQPEWHIEYVEEKPDLKVPPVFYMPYLYNQRVTMPIRWIGKIKDLKVEIVENDWGPYEWDPTKPVNTGKMATSLTPETFAWNTTAWNEFNGLSGDGSIEHLTGGKGNCHLGFLALALERNPVANIIDNYSFNGAETALDYLKSDYNSSVRNRARQDNRSFTASQLEEGTHGSENSADQKDYYNVVKEGDASTVMLPLFSRAKSMINGSGYSGNNPYEYFYRKAKLKITATFDLGNNQETTITEYSDVMQVPRITNPKGIWRDKGQTEDFKVILMTRTNSSNRADFTPMISDGSWSAEFESGNTNGNFKIVPGKDAEIDNSTEALAKNKGRIIGKTNTQMEFTVKFGGNPECAVIIVRYNGEKCIHKIFLRQGYDPIKINDAANAATWLSMNVYHGGDGLYNQNTTASQNGEIVKNPLSFGSYFKWNNVNEGIQEANNDKVGYQHLDPINDGTKTLRLSNDTDKEWRNIQCQQGTNAIPWQNINIKGVGECSLPTWEQFKSLADNSDFGFGIFYTDDAVVTQTNYWYSTGYKKEYRQIANVSNPDKSYTSQYGMRGVVVYNVNDARQLFFPFSASGHGRRRQAFIHRDYNDQEIMKRGYLCYGDVDYQLIGSPDNQNKFRPIPYNLPYSPGAIYWIKSVKADGHVEGTKDGVAAYYNCAGFDMNYFNFDFGAYTANNLYNSYYTKNVGIRSQYSTGSDALPIRLVLIE